MTETPLPLSASEIADIARRIKRPVVLVGLMGTGKSTVGRRLAATLQTDFVDTDTAIEEAAQLKVSEIFEEYGESYFRDGERRVIARLIEERHGIIATGGGAFVNDETRALILGQAIAVWINCDIDTLVERTGRKNTRPLLHDGDPKKILTRLQNEREPFYAKAHLRVASDDGPHETTVHAILEAIDRWL